VARLGNPEQAKVNWLEAEAHAEQPRPPLTGLRDRPSRPIAAELTKRALAIITTPGRKVELLDLKSDRSPRFT
jgi:hypothetical protein